jgi:hypothetical protein
MKFKTSTHLSNNVNKDGSRVLLIKINWGYKELINGKTKYKPIIVSSNISLTEEDWVNSKQWFRDRQDFANNTIMQVQMTLPIILAGTKLEATVDRDKFLANHRDRLSHARELKEVIESCGFVTWPFFQ